jgi:Fe-S oxidoreductase
MLAKDNVETLFGYGVKKIVTTCPHCFNTIANEYPEFGGKFETIHHSQLLTELVGQGRIMLRQSLSEDPNAKVDVVFHDSCYLGRYNGVYDPPRTVLASLPGVNLVEVAASRERGLCCGAGGAQFWKEEERGRTRVNFERTDQLLESRAKIIASACPFCMTMISDGLKQREREDVEPLDIAEVLLRACAIDKPMGRPAAVPGSAMAAPHRGKSKAAAA